MKGRILYGRNPPELVKEYTAAVGRMRALPSWITKGAIVGMQGGRDAVRDVWRTVKEYDVPLSAFWLQVSKLRFGFWFLEETVSMASADFLP